MVKIYGKQPSRPKHTITLRAASCTKPAARECRDGQNGNREHPDTRSSRRSRFTRGTVAVLPREQSPEAELGYCVLPQTGQQPSSDRSTGGRVSPAQQRALTPSPQTGAILSPRLTDVTNAAHSSENMRQPAKQSSRSATENHALLKINYMRSQ